MTRSRSHPAALALSALLLSTPRAAPAADPAAFLAAQADFERVLAGESGASDRAFGQFRKLVEAEPANPLYLAYLGSTVAIQAREAWAPWTKMRLAEKGLGLLDKALALLTPEHDRPAARGVPVSAEVRLNAAVTFLAVPSFMNRTEPARVVIADALASPAFPTTPGSVQARLLAQAALLARRDDQSASEAELLKKAIAAAPDAATAAPARARLAELGR